MIFNGWPPQANEGAAGSESCLRKELDMLVLGRKSAKSLTKKSLDQRYATVRITVPASTTDRVIDVTLIEIRPGKDTSRIGITADRDVSVLRLEIV